ncbi:hypothetical protein [Pseudomonas syringae group genomosp. 3]|uniref:DUF1983 domain-containing protein n=1 Tax=Pseudomonas syringae pv. maculicola TaxID=59511 RepID=A0A3M6CL30_PSEYM|nr:hypothetical protein [Pseudomonas syringae group genomosp. 3]RMV44429.1 hypothetical protein ALP13_02713 [Pseudomonas syringae pv. maculicola]
MQSHNYVPNISGWKLDQLTGEFEINSAKISVGGLPDQPQMITVTAGEWAARDLPENAWEYYAFIGSQITKIPAEYRASAKISTSDESYEPGFADIRVMLTYERRETAEELSARMKKSKGAGYSIKKEGDKFTFSHDGVPRIVLGNLDKADEKIETPFAVEGDQVSLAQAFIDAGKLSPDWVVRTTTNAAGQTVLAGVGAGLGCMCGGGYTGTPGDKEEKAEVKIDFTGDASKVLDQLLGTISETDLSEGLKNFNLGDFLSELKKDVVTRDDAQWPGRIKNLEACVVQLNSEIGRLVVAVSSLASGSAKQ